MTCIECKSKTKSELANYIADLGKCIIIIHNVPTDVCTQCGERFYSDEVSANIERLINQIKNLVSGIAEIDYTNAA